MRIAYICADRGIPVGGVKGASVHVRAIVEALARRGHDLRLLATRVGPSPDLAAEVIDVGFDRLPKQVRAEVAACGGDDVLARESYGLLLNTRLAQALDALDANWPVDAVYERFSLWSWAGLRFARERGVPYLLEVNAPLVDEQRSYRGLSLQPLARSLERVLLREADAVIVPASGLRPLVRSAAGRRRKVHVIPNGAELEMFDAPPWRPPDEVAERLRGRYVVAFLGTLKPWHGIRPLLRAFARLRRRSDRAHLLVIGDGPLGHLVQRACAEHGAEAMTWTGPVEHDRVPGWLGLADVGVAPYPPLDPFYFCPLKIVEYLAAGLPVVASDLGDVPRLVRAQRTGLLVRPGDARALADALRSLEGDPALRRRMSRRARAQALRRHGWGRAAEAIERIADAAIERRPGAGVPAPAGTAR